MGKLKLSATGLRLEEILSRLSASPTNGTTDDTANDVIDDPGGGILKNCDISRMSSSYPVILPYFYCLTNN